jgi:hypothetical protein
MFHYPFVTRVRSYGIDYSKDPMGQIKVAPVTASHLRGGRVPSPRLIGEVLRDLLDVDVVIDAPVVNKKSKTQARSRSDVRTSAI